MLTRYYAAYARYLLLLTFHPSCSPSALRLGRRQQHYRRTVSARVWPDLAGCRDGHQVLYPPHGAT